MRAGGDVDRRAAQRGTPRRFPRRVYDVGTEPDPRFSLANERTFLAWIRTALALLAGGVGLEALGVTIDDALRRTAAPLFVVLGILSVAQGWVGWARSERALRLGTPLPGPTTGVVLAAGALVAGVLVALGVSW